MISHRLLLRVLHYDPATGVFTWRPRTGRVLSRADQIFNGKLAGKVAGSIDAHGYRIIVIRKAWYKAHRLAWLYMTGEWPALDLDHRNTRKDDNRWVNLRIATRSQNQANVRVQKNNTSGRKGVSWDRQNKKWRVAIGVRRKRVGTRLFSSFDTACRYHSAVSRTYFGEFARPEG